MTTERWILAIGLLVGGLVLGGLAGWLVRRRLARDDTREATAAVSGVAGLFVFWVTALIGTFAALSLVEPDSLRDVPRQLLDYVPRIVVAGFVMIAGYAIAIAVSRLVGFGAERASGHTIVRVASTVRWAILVAAGILALSQLGVDTSILLVLVAVLGLAWALSFGLLVGLGGREIAREVAAGRYLRRVLKPDQQLRTRTIEGRLLKLGPAMIELETDAGERHHIPYSPLISHGFSVGDVPGREPEDRA